MARYAVVLCVIFLAAAGAFGQQRGFWATKTVTNADLQKYREERLKAERDFQKNHERMGFPSPEELERQRIEDLKTQIDLSTRLKQARLERERLEVERERIVLEAARIEAELRDREQETTERNYSYPGYSYPYGWGYPNPWYFPRFNRYYNGPTYRVSPFGVRPDGWVVRPGF